MYSKELAFEKANNISSDDYMTDREAEGHYFDIAVREGWIELCPKTKKTKKRKQANYSVGSSNA